MLNISQTLKGSDSGSQGAPTWHTGRIAFPEVNLGALAKTPDHRDSVVWDASRMATPAEASVSCDSGTRPRRGAAVRRLRSRSHRHLVVFRHAGLSDLSQ